MAPDTPGEIQHLDGNLSEHNDEKKQITFCTMGHTSSLDWITQTPWAEEAIIDAQQAFNIQAYIL